MLFWELTWDASQTFFFWLAMALYAVAIASISFLFQDEVRQTFSSKLVRPLRIERERFSADAPLLNDGARGQGMKYYYDDLFKAFDLFLYLSVFTTTLLMFLPRNMLSPYANSFASASLILIAPRVLGQIRGYSLELAFVSTVVRKAIIDILPFTVVIGILIIVFSVALSVSRTSGLVDCDFEDALGFSTYALLLGEFEQCYYFSTPSLRVMFAVYTFVMTIVMLNVAIGLIGDTLDSVQVDKAVLNTQIRAELIIDYERGMGEHVQRRRERFFPQWLHVMLREGALSESEDQQWAGRVVKVQSAVERLGRDLNTSIEAQQANLQRLDLKLDRAEARSDARMRELATASDISVLEKRLNSTVQECLNISTNVQRLLNDHGQASPARGREDSRAITPAVAPPSASSVRTSLGMAKSPPPKPAAQAASSAAAAPDDKSKLTSRMRGMLGKMGSSQTRL